MNLALKVGKECEQDVLSSRELNLGSKKKVCAERLGLEYDLLHSCSPGIWRFKALSRGR